jgi:AcrR family transcriptional regulator
MQTRSERTRSQLLQAGERLFAQHGYEGTTVARICQRAEVSKGAFYHHFPSKHSLFLQLLEDWLGQIDVRLRRAQEEAEGVPSALLEMAQRAEIIFTEARGRLPMFLEFLVQAHRDPAVWEATVAPYRRYQTYFAALFEEGLSQGSIQQVNPHVAARALVALAVGLLLQSVLEPEAEDWGTVTRESMAIALYGLAKETR